MIYLKTAIHAALKAGEEILKVYEKDFSVETKEDSSPLTEADKRSNKAILEILKPIEVPVISEEIKNLDYSQRSGWDLCWLIDPLDGTKEFIKRNGEFTVNIALIKNELPIMGIVYLPVSKKLYFASEEVGSFVINVNENDGVSDLSRILDKATKLPVGPLPDIYTIVASRSHLSKDTEAFIESCKKEHGDVVLVSMGSSLKLCMVAEGQAQVYPRLAPTMEWDTAAAHAIAKFSGCYVLDFNTRKELRYNKADLLNPYFIVLRDETSN